MNQCRACKSDNIQMFLPLGSHPPANTFLKEEQLSGNEASFTLDTYVCLDCALIQISNRIPADFFREYVYVPSASETLRNHFARLAETIYKRFLQSQEQEALVVDIGSNDGLF